MVKSMRAFLVFITMLFTANAALADTVYNDAFFRYDINMRGAATQISGAEAFASLNNLPDACSSLKTAIGNWNSALMWLDKAEKAPQDAADENRLSPQQIAAEREKINALITQTNAVIAKHCSQ